MAHSVTEDSKPVVKSEVRRTQTQGDSQRKRKYELADVDAELRSSKQLKAASTSDPAAVSPDADADADAAAGPARAVFPGAPANLLDCFTLLSQLGEGKFGVVRECVCNATGQRFACKSIAKANFTTDADVEAVRRETALLQALGARCASITQLRAVYEDDQAVHLVQELCEGGELFDHIVRRGRLPEAEAARIFHEVSSSVAFCHASGVLHRDLKPENILLQPTHSHSNSEPHSSNSNSEQYCVKLADFGLAVPLTPGAKTKGVAGSPLYIAPEIIKGGEYGLEADMWSLGVILYILLSGYPPFWGADDSAIFHSVLNSGNADVASGPWEEVSVEAKSLVRCMLQRNPARRPSSQKLLSHPWLLCHVYGGRVVRRPASKPTNTAVPAAAATVPAGTA